MEAFSGVIDSRRGLVLSSTTRSSTRMERIPCKRPVEEKFEYRACFPDTCARSPRREGLCVASGLRSHLVDVGMGIGSAIFVHGELYGGGGGSAGELGQRTVDERGHCAVAEATVALRRWPREASDPAIRNAIEKGVDSRVRTLSVETWTRHY